MAEEAEVVLEVLVRLLPVSREAERRPESLPLPSKMLRHPMSLWQVYSQSVIWMLEF